MCGIAGLYDHGRGGRPDADLVGRMNTKLAHRGPDDAGVHIEDRVALAMRRLSIIDLSTGHQPISNEDGTVWIVFNGEIYNFEPLRTELEAKGHVFKTKSDTETIVHLYEEEGVECMKRLRGMFAFALWDRSRERLLLARDRLGKKPLVYAEGGGRLAFASEIQALLELPRLSRQIDPAALDLYLSLQYIPAPRTIYRSIRKLPAAHRLVCEKGKTRVERYWDLPREGPPAADSFDEAKTLVREKLREATRLRLVSEVPLGAFLSGGIDSSCVVALMAEASSRPVKTFSIGFEEAEYSELAYAREVAERFGTEHTEFVVKSEMADVLPMLARHYGEPYADPSALPSYYVARETRRHVTVALNGDGGDEAFGGYLRYLAMTLGAVWDRLPAPGRALARAVAERLPEKQAPGNLGWRARRFLRAVDAGDPIDRYLHTICFFTEDEKRALYGPEMRGVLAGRAKAFLAQAADEVDGRDELNRWMRLDIRTYLSDCLMTKMDIASMAASLEARSPFLDHEFVELAARLPGRWKVKGYSERGTKHLLKEAFADVLPEKVRTRGKQGFGIPLGSWFRTRLKAEWERRVLGAGALARTLFDAGALERLWDEHQTGRRDHGYKLWALLMLEMWRETDPEAAL